MTAINPFLPKTSSLQVGQGAAWIVGLLAIAAIGWIDFATGTEVRVFPLYYLPIALVAWKGGRAGALIAAAICAAAWTEANSLAGMEFSNPMIWAANTAMLGTSFAVVGLLVATLRSALMREQGISRTDPLTSLPNGRAFREEADRILDLCRRRERPATLAYVDLDNFKTVNDTRGHQAGDGLLRTVARLLLASTRPSDLCARLGGDEFAILLPDADARGARVALERLRLELSQSAAAHACAITASIGAVTFLTVPESLDEMISAADARMYVAKTGGKNRVHLEEVGGPTPPPDLTARRGTPTRRL